MYARDVPPGTVFYHGTKADLGVGDLLGPGFGSNFAKAALRHVYFSATLEAAIWGAELAKGEGRERIYIVEPTGEYEERSAEPCRGHGEHCSPNLTSPGSVLALPPAGLCASLPGNITASYRSLHPLRIVGEVEGWTGHPPEQLAAMRTNLARMKAEGTDTIID